MLIDNVVVATDENHISEISRQLELAERFLEMPVIEVGCPWSPELVALVKPGPEIAATLTGAQPPEPINLCQACKASAAECNDCMDKECDGQNNTIKCDQYRKEEK